MLCNGKRIRNPTKQTAKPRGVHSHHAESRSHWTFVLNNACTRKPNSDVEPLPPTPRPFLAPPRLSSRPNATSDSAKVVGPAGNSALASSAADSHARRKERRARQSKGCHQT